MSADNNRLKVGIVGCGNIGADLCIALQKGTIPAQVVALTDIDRAKAKVFIRSFQLDAIICDLDENAEKSDYLIECASADAVRDVVEAAIRRHIDCLILSVGGLMDDPAGALAAVDASLRLTPGSPDAHHLRGMVLLRLGRVNAAVEELTYLEHYAPETSGRLREAIARQAGRR